MADLKDAIASTWASFGANAGPQTVAVWLQELSPYDGANLRAALREAANGETRPNLGAVKARYFALRDAAKASAQKNAPDLTAEERRRSDVACMKSCLWLHYAKGWQVSDFDGSVFAKNFGGDFKRAFTAALAGYDKDTILRWMDDQQRAGN